MSSTFVIYCGSTTFEMQVLMKALSILTGYEANALFVERDCCVFSQCKTLAPHRHREVG